MQIVTTRGAAGFALIAVLLLGGSTWFGITWEHMDAAVATHQADEREDISSPALPTGDVRGRPNVTVVLVDEDADRLAVASSAMPKPLDDPTHRMLVAINPIHPPSVVANITTKHKAQCPAFRLKFPRTADGKVNHETYVKYSRYVEQYCNVSGLLQMYVGLPTYIRFMDKIAEIVKMRNNSHIFDWGSGCGTMLNYFHLKYNTTGIGIDLTDRAVDFSRSHAQPGQLFCLLDGALLKYFPSEAFDAIVSWSTIHHVRRKLLQCAIAGEMVRMLRPGGVAFLGHLRTEKSQDYWRKMRCVPPGATVKVVKDFRVFHMPQFQKHQFLSVIITKNVGNTTSTAPHERPDA